jgi:hypothetical protein
MKKISSHTCSLLVALTLKATPVVYDSSSRAFRTKDILDSAVLRATVLEKEILSCGWIMKS